MKRNDETQEEYEARIAAYQERKEAKADRFDELAEKHTKESNQRYETATQATAGIPMGQPILVGHHSEGRHRAALKRQDTNMRKSIEHRDTAKYYANRADASRNNTAIFSDDPEALDKLKAKLESLVHLQNFMKAANKIANSRRKQYTREEKIADLVSKLSISEKTAKEIMTEDSFNRVGFASYQLSNNNAEINRIKQRIKKLERLNQMSHKRYPVANGVDYEEDPAAARLRFYFPDKPAEHVRQALKQHGFRWSPRAGAWQRQLTGNGQYQAQAVLPTIIQAYGELPT